MHAEVYEAEVLCTHCRPMVQGNSFIGMQCMQRSTKLKFFAHIAGLWFKVTVL